MIEGVLVAKKDFNIKHDELDTKNLYVSRIVLHKKPDVESNGLI